MNLQTQPQAASRRLSWMIGGGGIMIAFAGLWLSFRFGEPARLLLERSKIGLPALVLLFLMPVLAAAVWALAWRRRKLGVVRKKHGAFALRSVLFQLTCLVAVFLLGSGTLLLFMVGNALAGTFLQALILVLVFSGPLFLAGSIIRNATALRPSSGDMA